MKRSSFRDIPPYSFSSSLYDRLVGRYAFEHWRHNFERLERRYPLPVSRCANVACGTGLTSRYLAGRGAEVIAVDRSRGMLEAAALNIPGGVTLLQQDMRYLYLPRLVDTLVCATDSLNHLLRELDVRNALRSFYYNLIPGGYALFDMNTAWQLREGADTEPWDFEVDGHAMRWVSNWDDSLGIATIQFIFLYEDDGVRKPLVELHRERAYDTGWIKSRLEECGFDAVEILDASTLGKVDERTRRVQFVARRGG